jgi:FAD/FMN-containing dehydrogenase
VPHARFIELLAYKAQLVRITVILTEESYTSKVSFLDADPLPAAYECLVALKAKCDPDNVFRFSYQLVAS